MKKPYIFPRNIWSKFGVRIIHDNFLDTNLRLMEEREHRMDQDATKQKEEHKRRGKRQQ